MSTLPAVLCAAASLASEQKRLPVWVRPFTTVHHFPLRIHSFHKVLCASAAFTPWLCSAALRSSVSSFHSVSRYEELILSTASCSAYYYLHVAVSCLIASVSCKFV